MENFEELLENYLSIEEIEKKKEIDLLETIDEIKKENSSKNNNYLRTITIKDFVKYYLGTEHSCKNLKHKGLKSFNNPYVIGIPNDFAIKNPDCIVRGEIVVVLDDYNNYGTYINPILLKNIQTMEECNSIRKILNKVYVDDLSKIQELYEESLMINQKILELEKSYTSGIDLLSSLKKGYVLKRIREFAILTQQNNEIKQFIKTLTEENLVSSFIKQKNMGMIK